METKYLLEKILEAAKAFEQEDGVTDILASDIKAIQSSKDSCSLEEVKEIDIETLSEAMSKHTRCVDHVVSAIIQKYKETPESDLEWKANFQTIKSILGFIQDIFLKFSFKIRIMICLWEFFLSLKKTLIRL